jgi:hypothetical protein
LKYPKDKNTGEPDVTKAPTMKIKVDFYDGDFKCEIYDMNRTLLFPNKNNASGASSPMEFIPKGINVALVIKCGGLWFANGKFGCTWKLLQAAVKPKASLKGQCLIQLNTDDVDRATRDDAEQYPSNSPRAAATSVQDKKNDSVELVNDSDDEKEEKNTEESSQQEETHTATTTTSSSAPTFETTVQPEDKKLTVGKKKVVRKST